MVQMPARFIAAVAALFCAACAAPPATAPRSIMATDARSGVMAVSAVGARNVRVLYVRPPSIVLLREVFVPEGEHVTAVRFAGSADALIVDTDAERFALDTHTWRLAQIRQEARGVAAGAHARRRG
jgi:hypothetical protein